MINCDHFVYGYFKGTGYKLLKSQGIDDIISKDSLNELSHLGTNLKEETRIHVWLPKENVVCHIYLRPDKDEYGRKTVWNHTIIIKISDYLKLMPELFEPYFIHELQYPEKLVPIEVKK